MKTLYGFLLGLLCLLSQASYAQTLTYRQEAEQVLAPLNKSLIPTCVLYGGVLL